jgi:hypothetical protein
MLAIGIRHALIFFPFTSWVESPITVSVILTGRMVLTAVVIVLIIIDICIILMPIRLIASPSTIGIVNSYRLRLALNKIWL